MGPLIKNNFFDFGLCADIMLCIWQKDTYNGFIFYFSNNLMKYTSFIFFKSVIKNILKTPDAVPTANRFYSLFKSPDTIYYPKVYDPIEYPKLQ